MSEQPGVAAPPAKSLVWSHDFQLYVVSRAISLVGSALTIVALPILVYGLTHSALWTSVVSVTEALPYLLVGLFAGVVADSRNRLRIMVAAELSSGLLLATIPLTNAMHALTPAQIAVVALLSRCMFVFFDAANFGELVTLVTDRGLPKANSVIYGGSSVIDIAGPVVAGVLLSVQSPVLLVTFDAATFVVSAVLLLNIRSKDDLPTTSGTGFQFTQRAKEGLVFLWNKRLVRNMTLVNALLCFSAGAFYAEVVVWADRTLHISRGNFRLGVLYGAFGVGAVLGSVASASMHDWMDAQTRRSLLFLAAGASGVATFLSPNWIASAIGVALWAFCYITTMISSITARQLSTPPELQGRVNIVGRSISLGIGWPLGAGAAGLIAAQWEARASLVACMLPLCAVGLYGLRHTGKPVIRDA